MADTTFSVRVDNETKDKLAELAEQSGLTAKDFLIRLVTTYESSQVRESMAESKELESLRHHLARVEEIYISLVKGAQDRQEFDAAKITQALEEAQQAKAQALDAQAQAEKVSREAGERINTAEAEAALAWENAHKEIQVMRETLARVEDAREQSSRLAALAEKAAADAEAKVESLKELAEESEAIRQELGKVKQEREQLERDLNKAQQELQDTVGLRDADVKAVGEEWEKRLQQALERAEFEKDKAVLDAQRQALAEMRELQDALAKCREEKATLEIEMAKLKGSTQDDSGE